METKKKVTSVAISSMFVRCAKSGEVWAVQVENGRIVATCGPLHHSEVLVANLDSMHWSEDDADWLDGLQTAVVETGGAA